MLGHLPVPGLPDGLEGAGGALCWCGNGFGAGDGPALRAAFTIHSSRLGLALPWLSGLCLALQRAVQFLTGLSSLCWKDKPLSCARPNLL